MKNTVYPILIVTIMALIVPSLIYIGMEPSILRLVTITGVSFITTAISIWVGGLEKGERDTILLKMKFIIKRIKGT